MSKRIFISHANDTSPDLIAAVLNAAKEAGCTVLRGDQTTSTRTDSTEEVQSAIHRADILVAILDRPRANVIFELGFAMGAGKDAVLVAETQVPIPSNMASIPCVRIAGDEAKNSKSICRMLTRLDEDQKSWHRKLWKKGTRELATCFEQPAFLAALEPRRFEDLVAELLTEMGYEITRVSEEGKAACDFIATRRSAVGNFVYLIEVKKTSRQSRVSVEHVHRLLEATLTSHATAGLLISSSGFTSSALALANNSKPRLTLLTLGDLLDLAAKGHAKGKNKKEFNSDASAG